MNFLFWICWVMDVLIVALALLGRGFRVSFGAGTDWNTLVIGLFGMAVVSALVLRLAGRPRPALVLALVPPAILCLLYWLEVRNEG